MSKIHSNYETSNIISNLEGILTFVDLRYRITITPHFLTVIPPIPPNYKWVPGNFMHRKSSLHEGEDLINSPPPAAQLSWPPTQSLSQTIGLKNSLVRSSHGTFSQRMAKKLITYSIKLSFRSLNSHITHQKIGGNIDLSHKCCILYNTYRSMSSSGARYSQQ